VVKTVTKSSKASAAKTAPMNLDQAKRGSFASNLRRLRLDANLSQSDLARKIWGDTTDSRGYTVARNRDRISYYEAKKAVPEAHTLKVIADVLRVSVEELAPDLIARETDKQKDPEISMAMVKDRADLVHLRVNTLCTLALASKIIALLTDERGRLAAMAAGA
jgi:transcriptional regulator with XRE-family HTH domain